MYTSNRKSEEKFLPLHSNLCENVFNLKEERLVD